MSKGLIFIDDLSNGIKNLKIDGNDIVKKFNVLSIDVGIINLALVVAEVDIDFNLLDVIDMQLVDITMECNDKNCVLYHQKTFTDWLSHVFVKYADMFNKACYIIVEKQPMVSALVAIEQLIFSKYRHKTLLISPNSVHKFFNIGEYCYEERKIKSVEIAKKVLNEEMLKRLEKYERKHDIADCNLILMYWCDKKNKEIISNKRNEYLKERSVNPLYVGGKNMSIYDFFEHCKYNKK